MDEQTSNGGRATARPTSERTLYVGYLPMTHAHKRCMRVIVPLLLWLNLMVMGFAVWQMGDGGTGVWDTTETISVTGELRIDPYARLIVNEGGGTHSILLVQPGKFGAAGVAGDFEDQMVTVTGNELNRDGFRMIELLGTADLKAIEPAPGAARPAQSPQQAIAYPDVRLTGEVVDAKCYMGAMRPGAGKSHKACALLCLRGGIPPVLVTPGPEGTRHHILLTDEEGQALDIDAIARFVAHPVEIRGIWSDMGDGYERLRVPVGGIRLLP